MTKRTAGSNDNLECFVHDDDGTSASEVKVEERLHDRLGGEAVDIGNREVLGRNSQEDGNDEYEKGKGGIIEGE